MGIVTIKVYDEVRQTHQKFFCEVNVLLSSMRYFKHHLKNVSPVKDFEISVYCDIPVFAWLLRYVKSPGGHGPNAPQLTKDVVLPILISSNFLQMEELVAECIREMSAHFTALLQECADLGALADDLLQRLAKEVGEKQLEEAWAKASNAQASAADSAADSASQEARALVLINKLYKMKVEHLLKLVKTTVLKCAHCAALFSAAHISLLRCPATRRGVQTGLHEMDRSWSFRKHVAELRGAHEPWRTIFWHVWGIVTVLYCFRCERYFSVSQYACCTGAPAAAAPTSLVLHEILPSGGLGKLPPGMELDRDSVQTCLYHMEAQRDLICSDTVTAPILLGHSTSKSPHQTPPDALAVGPNHPRTDHTSPRKRSSGSFTPDDGAGAVMGRVSDGGTTSGRASEDGYTASEVSHTERDLSRAARLQAVSQGSEEGSLLATVGGHHMSVDDLGLGDDLPGSVAFRMQICQEEDRRRMDALLLVLESFRDDPGPIKVKGGGAPNSRESPAKRPKDDARPASARVYGASRPLSRLGSARPSSAKRRDARL